MLKQRGFPPVVSHRRTTCCTAVEPNPLCLIAPSLRLHITEQKNGTALYDRTFSGQLNSKKIWPKHVTRLPHKNANAVCLDRASNNPATPSANKQRLPRKRRARALGATDQETAIPLRPFKRENKLKSHPAGACPRRL